MRNPFRRRSNQTDGRSGLLESRGLRPGAYTVEIPDVGSGHYIYDPSDPCAIHSRRFEAWCDVNDFDTARDELHWHCLVLSENRVPAEGIRAMGEKMISARQKRITAEREMSLGDELAVVEGNAKSATARADGEREERRQAEEREAELRREAEAESEKLAAMRKEFDSLPRRARVKIKFSLVATVSLSFLVFDVGVLGNAFSALSGDDVWKIVLTIGVSLAPLSSAIGIAQWLSAAELAIRKPPKASWLALVAGVVCAIGILLIILFRKAVNEGPPLPTEAFYFLAFIQVGLAMSETMIYTVYFDSKVGLALNERIELAETEVSKINARAVSEHERARKAQGRIGEIEQSAQQESSRLQRESKKLDDVRDAEEGSAGELRAIVDSAILEGIASRENKERRQKHEEEEERSEQPSSAAPALIGAMAVVIIVLTASTAGVF